MEGFCEQNEFPHHNLFDDLEGTDASQLWVSTTDQHPNAKGHALVAGPIYDFSLEVMNTPKPKATPAAGSKPAGKTKPKPRPPKPGARTKTR